VTTVKNTQIPKIQQAQGIKLPFDVLQGLKNWIFIYFIRLLPSVALTHTRRVKPCGQALRRVGVECIDGSFLSQRNQRILDSI
jgi:hypothetical protein